MNAEIQAILSRYDLPNSVLLGDLRAYLTGDELERVHYLLKYLNEKTEPKGGRQAMINQVVIVKGEKTTEETLNKVISFVKRVSEDPEIEISNELICLDAPSNGAQIIWADGTDCFIAPNKEASDD